MCNKTLISEYFSTPESGLQRTANVYKLDDGSHSVQMLEKEHQAVVSVADRTLRYHEDMAENWVLGIH